MTALAVAGATVAGSCLVGTSFARSDDPGGAAPPKAPARMAAAAGDFATSFETTDTQPTYTNTVDTDAGGNKLTAGLSGTNPGLPGSVMSQVGAVTANAENAPNEVANNMKDGDVNTKWLTFTNTGWVRYQMTAPVAVQRYQLASANDTPTRDPSDWQFQGSQDGSAWTTLDTRTGESFSGRYASNTYNFTNTTAYAYYRLNITKNHGDGDIQLSEMVLSDGSATVPPPSDMKSEPGNGPVSVYTAKSAVGWTGLRAFRYGGSLTADGHDYAYNKVFDVSIPVTSTTQLSYMIYPEFSGADYARQSTFAAVDLGFDDGTFLRNLPAVDQHGFGLNAVAQGNSKSLYAQQWNAISSTIGAVAAGKTITKILIDYDNPAGKSGQAFQGWIDDLKVTGSPAVPNPSHLSDWVETRRGTNANGSFSRGNNIPATAVPHGFNFWTPETSANSTSWLYTYQENNNASNRPTLQAFAISHEPSPWMGDRQTFEVMPSPTATPTVSRTTRALPFSHDNETGKPYYYGVTFDNGLKTEIAPTDHAAIMRFTFTGNASSLIFDNVNNSGGATLTPSNGTGQTVLTGYSDTSSGSLSVGAKRMFIYATFDQPSTGGGQPASTSGAGGASVTRYLNFDTSTTKVVSMRIATSFISVAQAQHNLDLEVPAGTSFDDVKTAAQAAWDKNLGVITVEGGTPDQMTTLYSDLYRLNLYPNSTFENTGTADAPVYMHANQASTASSPGTGATATVGTAPIAGKAYANNGFWDTYRTVWASDALLYPSKTGEMVDGFVSQYKDGGWIARWSSPGYANLMDGASSDVAFSTAYQMGAPLSDVGATFDAAVKNSSVVPPNANVGRKGLETSAFLGYTPASSTEGFSWAVDGYINDFGVANMAKSLYDKAADNDPRKAEYWDDYQYFLNRSTDYVNEFDPSIGMFQSRSTTGAFTVPAASWDPRIWGTGNAAGGGSTEFTETDPWNMQFTVPQDGQGLANLYGGKAALAAKLDQFFSTPELATGLGSYGVIHEMTEASAVRMGEWGLSNQPSHHIPYMYDFAGQPSKGQALIREALSRQFIGSEIGQGYPGDEDNGELSAWQVMSSMGIYPLQMGTANWAVGSPLFKKATIHLENGKDLVINAPNNSTKNVYVQGLKINGQSYSSTSIPTSTLTNGATLDFDMGPAASTWGTGADDAPPSITKGDKPAAPLMDATSSTTGTATSSTGAAVTGLFDNTSTTRVALASQTPWVQYQFDGPRRRATIYTITSGNVAGDPKDWTLQGSNDGSTWTDLDQRSGQAFTWRLYTKPFTIAHPGYYGYYRLNVTANTGEATTSLAELELLSPAADTVGPTVTITTPQEGSTYLQGDVVAADYSCADSDSGLADCVGTAAAGAPLDTAQPGDHTFTVTAHDNAGNATTVTRHYVVYPAVRATSPVGGTVNATLALTLGAPASFGAFTPGVTADYTASTTATVTSTAGDATLSVADPSSTATGHLVNGAFSLPSPLQARARNAANSGTAYNNVGSSASPLNLLMYGGPISNDAVTLQFSQHIGSTDALRTGSYAKTLTFTLSTTTP
jgi:predicted alpha-1,2-mannosidase